MKLPRPRAVQFQISVKARVRKGAPLPKGQSVSDIVKAWAEGGELPEGWAVKVNVWEHGKSREVTPGEDQRGANLRATLARALQEGRLTIKKVGGAR